MSNPTPADLLRFWRVQGGKTTIPNAKDFDELVVGSWLHVEAMSHSTVWMRLGPLHVWVRKRGERIDIALHREPEERPYEVTVHGDIESDVVHLEALKWRALLAYEVARRWDRCCAPTAKRLRRVLKAFGFGPVRRHT